MSTSSTTTKTHPALEAVSFLLRDRVRHGDVHSTKEAQYHLDAIEAHLKELDPPPAEGQAPTAEAPLPPAPELPVQPPAAVEAEPSVSSYIAGIIDDLKK